MVKTPLKAPRTARDCCRIRRLKATDPVAKKIVATRRRPNLGCGIERRAAGRSLGTALAISVLQ
jgi:hypothetical protein